MAQEVYMDVPVVRGIAKTFKEVGNVLDTVAKTMQYLMDLLKATAFIGNVGGGAVLHFLEIIKPHIDDMAKKCHELFSDLNKSVDAFERGDELGATRFY